MIYNESNAFLECIRQLGNAENLDALEQAYALAVAQTGGGGFGVYLLGDAEGSLELLMRGDQFGGPDVRLASELDGKAYRILAGGCPVWPVKILSSAFLPLCQAGTVFGFVELENARGVSDIARMQHEVLADVLAKTLVSVEMREDLGGRLIETETHLHRLTDMAGRLNTLELELIAARFLEAALNAAEAHVGAVLLRKDEEWAESFERGIQVDAVLAVQTEQGKPAALECARTGAPVIVNGPEGHFAFLPLKQVSELHGVCCLVRGAGDDPFEMDELPLPMASFASVMISNARFHDESLERERWHAAVAVANEIQEGLMPRESLKVEGFDIGFHWVSSEVVGGDYLDLIPQPDGLLRVVVGDVTGHGVGPALLMTSTRAALRMLSGERAFGTKLVCDLNRFLVGNVLPLGMFVTLFVAELDPRNGKLRYVSAGHNPALVLAGDGAVRCELESTGMPVGIVDDADYECAEVSLAPGETLVAYTDGLVEARAPSREQLGMERFQQMLADGHDTAADMVESVRLGLKGFCQSTPPHDDVTFVIIKRQ